MTRGKLKGLIVLNVALLMGLTSLMLLSFQAEAQMGGQRRGDYVMVAGRRAGGGVGNSIYITDLNNAVMLAIENNCNNNLEVVAFRRLSRDFGGGGGGGGGTGGGGGGRIPR